MKSSSKKLLSVAAVLGVVLIVFVLLHLPGPSDQDQILAQLETARAAGERHDVRGLMQVISADYHDSNGFNNDQLSVFLHRFAGQDGSATVALSPPTVRVQGDTADTVGQVTVRGNGQVYYDHPVTLHWKREDGTRWLVFPTKVWRVVGAEYPAPGGGDEGGGGLL